ncbi:hypothetical protein CR513_28143, partial [Mucuna pruriens]
MCDASNSALGAILGQRVGKQPHKSNAKPRLIRWMLLLQEFDLEIKDKKVHSGSRDLIDPPFLSFNIWRQPLWMESNSSEVLDCGFGVPRVLISDQGSHFCNHAMYTLLEKYGVVHKVAIVYHPQTNDQAKVFNREIKKLLQKYGKS